MLHLTLTAEQQRELQTVSRQAVGRVALRAHMVLVSGRGCPVAQIALIHACGEDVVRIWLHRYQRQGVVGLYDQPKSGRPPKDRRAGPIIDAQASQSPRCSGHVQACWSVGRLTCFLARRFRLRLSLSSVRRYLHRMGWRWARPRLAPATARQPDPDAPLLPERDRQEGHQGIRGIDAEAQQDQDAAHPERSSTWRFGGRHQRIPCPRHQRVTFR